MVKPSILHWLVGIGLGGVSGVYLAQNYQLPIISDLYKRISNFASSYENNSNSESKGNGGPDKPS